MCVGVYVCVCGEGGETKQMVKAPPPLTYSFIHSLLEL